MANVIKKINTGGTTYPIDRTFTVTGLSTVAGNGTSGSYLSVRWYCSGVEGLTAPYDGMRLMIKIPLAGVATAGAMLSINGNTASEYHPLAYNKNTVFTTHYAVDTYKIFVYDASATMSVYKTSNISSLVTGVWKAESNYDSNTNYYPIRSYTSGLQISSYSGSTNCQLYVPYATDSQFGVIKVGSGLSVSNGVLSASGGGGGSGITEISDENIHPRALTTGFYKLTHSSPKVYNDGLTGTSALYRYQPPQNSLLFVTYSGTLTTWYCFSSATGTLTNTTTFAYGAVDDSSGDIPQLINPANLLTSHRTLYQHNITVSSSSYTSSKITFSLITSSSTSITSATSLRQKIYSSGSGKVIAASGFLYNASAYHYYVSSIQYTSTTNMGVFCYNDTESVETTLDIANSTMTVSDSVVTI